MDIADIEKKYKFISEKFEEDSQFLLKYLLVFAFKGIKKFEVKNNEIKKSF